MTTKISLLSAALAIGSFAALPALAQSMTSPAPAASVEGGVKTDAKVQSPAEVKAKTKAAQNTKLHQQVAQHPSAAAKAGGTVKSDAATPDTSSK